MPRFTFPDSHGDLLGAHISTKGGLHTVFDRAKAIKTFGDMIDIVQSLTDAP